MKTITIAGREYKLEYSFEAAEHRDTVQKMFNVLSGAYIVKKSASGSSEDNGQSTAEAMIDGVSAMVADIPHIVKTAFYSGLLENNPVSEDEAYALMKQYLKENKTGYGDLYEDIKACMEDDGFFDLSGLTNMVRAMEQGMEKSAQEKMAKTPQDHQKKSTSTK